MKIKDYYIQRLTDLLKECDSDTVEAVYRVVLGMQERRSNGAKRYDHQVDSKNK